MIEIARGSDESDQEATSTLAFALVENLYGKWFETRWSHLPLELALDIPQSAPLLVNDWSLSGEEIVAIENWIAGQEAERGYSRKIFADTLTVVSWGSDELVARTVVGKTSEAQNALPLATAVRIARDLREYPQLHGVVADIVAQTALSPDQVSQVSDYAQELAQAETSKREAHILLFDRARALARHRAVISKQAKKAPVIEFAQPRRRLRAKSTPRAVTPKIEFSDAQLVQRVQNGENAAFGEIYDRYSHAIWLWLLRRCGNLELAEDLTGDVFMRALDYMGQNGSVDYLSSWLYKIASNALVDYRRQQTRRQTQSLGNLLKTDMREYITIGEPEAGLDVEAILAYTQILSAWGRLNESYQQVLYMRFVEGLSHREVGEVLGQTIAAVKVRQHRALIQLRTLLKSDDF